MEHPSGPDLVAFIGNSRSAFAMLVHRIPKEGLISVGELKPQSLSRQPIQHPFDGILELNYERHILNQSLRIGNDGSRSVLLTHLGLQERLKLRLCVSVNVRPPAIRVVLMATR